MGTVDCQLAANLVVRYVTSRHDRRVLELISSMFSFTSNDKEAVGLIPANKGGGEKIVSSLLSAIVGAEGRDSESGTPPVEIKGDSLGDQWLSFLMAASEVGGSVEAQNEVGDES